MDVRDASVKGFAESLKAKGKLPATVESYSRDARDFLGFLARHRLATNKVEPETLVAFQEHLTHVEREKANSVRRKIIGVRQFYRYLAESHRVKSTPFDDVPLPIRNEVMPRNQTLDKVTALIVKMTARPDGLKAARDRAIVQLLAFEGLKAHELIDLEWRDFYHGPGLATLSIRGSRARVVTLAQETGEAILAYRERFGAINKTRPRRGAAVRMFIAFQGRDGATPIPNITRHGLKFLLYELGDGAGLSHCNTELLRHHAIQHQLYNGRAPEEIMTHLGLRRLGIVAKHLGRMKQDTERERTD